MKRIPTLLLQAVTVLIGIGTLAFLLWEPHFEGRNAHATFFAIYFKDLFLAYAYIAAIPFFAALYQAFKLLSYIGRNEVFSGRSVKALRTIKYCAMAIVGFVVGAEAYLFLAVRGKDDIAGGVAMGILISFISIVVATAAAVLEKTLQSAVDI